MAGKNSTSGWSRREFLQAAAQWTGACGSGVLASAASPPAPACEVILNVDPSDPPRYNAVPFDEEFIDGIFAKCAAYKVRTVFWRVGLGRAYYHSRYWEPVRPGCCGERWDAVARVVERLDPFRAAVEAARRHGVKIYAWTLFNEMYVDRGDVRMVEPWFARNLHLFWSSRDRSRYFLGIPCLAEPEARRRLLAITEEISSYGVDGIYLCTRGHSVSPGENALETPTPRPDEFGFNPPIVEEFQRRYGVDIRRQPFDNEAWQRLKGEYLTSFLREMRGILAARGQKLLFSVRPDRYHLIASDYGSKPPAHDSIRLYKDWETWLQGGILDGLVSVPPRNPRGDGRAAIGDLAPLTETLSPEARRKLYTWAFTVYSRPRDANFQNLSMENWYLKTPATLQQQHEMARRAGAAGIIFHEMYMHFFFDTRGKSVGDLGAFPKDEYWAVVEKANSQSG